MLPVFVPLMAVHDGTVAGHPIEASDAPSGGGLFQSAADQVFARHFHLAAADRADFLQAFGIMHVGHVVAQTISQCGQNRGGRALLGKLISCWLPAVLESLLTPFENCRTQ